MRVLGTVSLSMTRIQGVHLIAAKYSAETRISSSVMTFARSIMVFVFGFLGSADRLSPLRKSCSCRMKYPTGNAAGGAFSGRPLPFGR